MKHLHGFNVRSSMLSINISKPRNYLLLWSGMHGITDFTSCLYDRGNICYNRGDFEEAGSLFGAAEEIFTKENPLAPHATASQLKLGCIDIRQGNFVEAMSAAVQQATTYLANLQ